MTVLYTPKELSVVNLLQYRPGEESQSSPTFDAIYVVTTGRVSDDIARIVGFVWQELMMVLGCTFHAIFPCVAGGEARLATGEARRSVDKETKVQMAQLQCEVGV